MMIYLQKQSTFSQADSYYAGKEIPFPLPHLFWNTILQYHVHNSSPLVPILRNRNASPNHTVYIRSIVILFFHLWLGKTRRIFLSDFPTKILYAFLISLTCHIRLIILNLITPEDTAICRSIVIGEFDGGCYSVLCAMSFAFRHDGNNHHRRKWVVIYFVQKFTISG
jgi:hypothetical protein